MLPPFWTEYAMMFSSILSRRLLFVMIQEFGRRAERAFMVDVGRQI